METLRAIAEWINLWIGAWINIWVTLVAAGFVFSRLTGIDAVATFRGLRRICQFVLLLGFPAIGLVVIGFGLVLPWWDEVGGPMGAAGAIGLIVSVAAGLALFLIELTEEILMRLGILVPGKDPDRAPPADSVADGGGPFAEPELKVHPDEDRP